MVKILVSACVLGAPVRYNGKDKKSSHPVLDRWVREGRVVSVCPEVLGGLGTPRAPSEIVRIQGLRRVAASTGRDVTAEFERGAALALDQALTNDVRVAVLKEGSPSCGSTWTYDGTFSGTRIAGEGVATELLRRRGIQVFSEEEIDAADALVDRLEAS
ncbi:MAG TPA: DUF523 domain-containing protein [Vicinamibacterales bacterium]|jgi:uncharacterized protein YbbK (DUF523 family)|nr:DUF523 domain-containing protein [Vicinamibacterales bacterium]